VKLELLPTRVPMLELGDKNHNELNSVCEYIIYNPLQWCFDHENPWNLPMKNTSNLPPVHGNE